MCEEILVDSVICSDNLCVYDCEKNIQIPSVTIPEGSTIKGTINVSVLELRPIIDIACRVIKAAVTFFIEKELTVKTPSGKCVPLEYGFRIERLIDLTNCCMQKLENTCNISGLKLRLFDICVNDEVALHPSTAQAPASFDEKLTVGLMVKLVIKKQITLPDYPICDCCPPKNCSPNLLALASIFPFMNKGSPQNYRY